MKRSSMIDSLFSIGYSIQVINVNKQEYIMGKKSKKLMKAAALAGAAYLASKTMAPKEKTPIKDYLTKDHKINYKAGDRNPNMPSISKKYSYKTDPLTGGTVRDKVISSKVEAESFGGPNLMLSPKKGGYIKAKNGTMVSKGQGMVMRPKKTIIS
jgi:hypothetical protein